MKLTRVSSVVLVNLYLSLPQGGREKGEREGGREGGRREGGKGVEEKSGERLEERVWSGGERRREGTEGQSKDNSSVNLLSLC